MNVAFLHPDLGIGGAERLVIDAARALQARGHRTVIFTAQHDPARSFDDSRDGTLDVRVRGTRLPAQIAGRLRAPCAIARMCRLAGAATRAGERFDVVFCDVVAHVVPLLRRLTAAPVVYYCHFPDRLLAPSSGGWRRAYRLPIDRLEEIGTRLADRVLVNSAFTAAMLRQAFPRLAVTPEVLHPGVDAARYAAGDPPSACRAIVAVSRFMPEKNLDLAVAAFAALRRRVPADVFAAGELVIAGGHDARLRESRDTLVELAARAETLGVDGQVSLLRSPTDDERRRLLARARCVLYPPPREHFGYVPLEAMAAGRPVVAVNAGGPAETVVDGETGFLRAADPEAFADALQRLVTEPDTADRLGAAGRQRVERCYALERFGARLEEILLGVSRRPRPGAR